jgi:hypothetical protein
MPQVWPQLGIKAPIAMEWVTVADIGGTGTTVVESTAIQLPFPDVDFYDLIVEVGFTGVVTKSSGSANVWVKFRSMAFNTGAADGIAASDLYLPKVAVGVVARTRKILFKPSIIENDGSGTVTDRYFVFIRAKGNAENTTFSVAGIKARIIYIPL